MSFNCIPLIFTDNVHNMFQYNDEIYDDNDEYLLY